MLDQISRIPHQNFWDKKCPGSKKIWPVVDEIKRFEEEIKALSDEELKQKTVKFQRAHQRTEQMMLQFRSKRSRKKWIPMMNR
jgi:preprotein translocase subunit SecA